MIASVVGTLKSFSVCSRRKPQPSSLTQKDAVDRNIHGGKLASKSLYNSDDIANLSTDAGEFNTDIITTSGSDTDARSWPYQRKAGGVPLVPPPGLGAPPGLSEPYPAADWSNQGGQSKAPWGSRLNSQAPAFLPSHATGQCQDGHMGQNNPMQLRQSIRHLKAALEDWEENHLAGTQYPEEPVAPVEDSTVNALKHALDKLTPQDAAMVRIFLDNKEAEQKRASTQFNPMPVGGNYQSSQRPPGQFYRNDSARPWNKAADTTLAHRPFRPFQGQRSMAGEYENHRGGRPERKTQWNGSAADDSAETLRTNLRDLAEMDSARVLMVRKINRLGVDSAKAIEAYFSKYGTIDRVMVTHSRSRQTPDGPARLRPATVGFLVMSKPEAVQAALTYNGGEHIVNGVAINVGTFKSHPIDAKE